MKPFSGIFTENNLSPEDEELEDEDEDFDDGIPFTTKMREVTKQVHKLSDNLVNAKLGLAMSDDKVWREGLLIFYEVFNFLESSLQKLRKQIEPFDRISQTLDGLERSKAFEADLNYYYGQDYLHSSSYTIRPTVGNYLKHLKLLEEREPLRLLAYVYHLYMGLLSGGQLLKKKRDIKKKVYSLGGLLNSTSFSSSSAQNQNTNNYPTTGDAATTFNTSDNRTISDIKKQIRFIINDIASDLTKDEKNSILAESIIVFKQNNNIIRSIENTGFIAIKNIFKNVIILIVIIVAVLFIIQFFRE